MSYDLYLIILKRHPSINFTIFVINIINSNILTFWSQISRLSHMRALRYFLCKLVFQFYVEGREGVGGKPNFPMSFQFYLNSAPSFMLFKHIIIISIPSKFECAPLVRPINWFWWETIDDWTPIKTHNNTFYRSRSLLCTGLSSKCVCCYFCSEKREKLFFIKLFYIFWFCFEINKSKD